MDATALDYIVTKPASFHLTAEQAELLGFTVDESLGWEADENGDLLEGEIELHHGLRIPGDIAESWGGGRVVNHLCNNRILAAVPADGSYVAPVAAAPALVQEPQSPAVADEHQALKERVAELEAERVVHLAALEAYASGSTEPGVEVEQTESLSDWGSEEWLAGFDALSESDAVAAIAEWATDDDSIRSMLEHEATHANRGEVLATLEAKLNESPLVETPAEEPKQTFPVHKAAGIFTLSDGTEVKGKQAAISAQAELDAKSGA